MYQHESLQLKSVPGKTYFPQRGLFDQQGFSGLLATVIARAFKAVHQKREIGPFPKKRPTFPCWPTGYAAESRGGWTRMYGGLWGRSKSCVHQWVERYRKDPDLMCFEDQLRRTDAWIERYAGRIPTEVYERKVDGVVDALAGWMLRTMDEKSQRRRWRGVLVRLVKKMWTVSKELFFYYRGAFERKRRVP